MLFAKRKAPISSLREIFQKKKISLRAPFRSFPEKNRQSQSATLVTFRKSNMAPQPPFQGGKLWNPGKKPPFFM